MDSKVAIQSGLFYDENDEANNALLVMELLDYNDDYIHKEIKRRSKRIKEEEG